MTVYEALMSRCSLEERLEDALYKILGRLTDRRWVPPTDPRVPQVVRGVRGWTCPSGAGGYDEGHALVLDGRLVAADRTWRARFSFAEIWGEVGQVTFSTCALKDADLDALDDVVTSCAPEAVLERWESLMRLAAPEWVA